MEIKFEIPIEVGNSVYRLQNNELETGLITSIDIKSKSYIVDNRLEKFENHFEVNIRVKWSFEIKIYTLQDINKHFYTNKKDLIKKNS